jgi:hypothetical protein
MAGLLAGAVLIVLFFFFDLARGEPLATPTFLSGALLGEESVVAAPLRIALFTIAHFAVFIVLGIIAAVVVDLTGIPRNLLLGTAYGLFGCSLVFYAALVISGARILQAPAWPVVFFGNVVAGAVMVGYLRWAGSETGLTGVLSRLAGQRVFREGITVGLLGAGAVALWFLIVDSVVGRPLFTPGALGSAFLYGVAAADNVVVSASTVVGYTLFHIAGFITVGVVASALVTHAERFPPLFFGLIILFVVFETFFVFMAAMLGTWLMEELAWWSVLAGNLLGALVMGGYLWKAHPELQEKLRDEVLWAEP